MPVIRVEVPAGTPADTQKTIRTAVKAAVLKTLAPKEFIEGWYNPHRRHQGLGYHSPMDFESHHQEAA